ncbi:Aldo/keto reductase family protein [Singulisphaera sp. GP187]|uniref:aldo/keto reductase n=1 Tax=Singulisphaera sp. GP187 TaxID=1882752 RepID=UPI00092B22A4|nr:aldo/keto reductase [Singulisphaera sp. GP187]SIO34997.1 Aldo/keto reductase family protein [Singulisphaera sp. GP187]
MTPLNRRDFLARTTVATTALAAATATATTTTARAARANLPKSPTDKVTLGKSGVQVSLIGMGTGSHGNGQASNQTKLGVKEFTKVVRHALDRGICFFDVADQYGSHVYLREALKGVPRESYVIQTKTHATQVPDCRSHLERYRMELGVDYIDIVLLHCMTKKGWPAENKGSMDYLREAKEQKIIRAHGTSCHGMDPLRTAAKDPFVEIDLARINPEGLIMDDKRPDEVVSQLEEMHLAGKGVVGMKIFGEGAMKEAERRDASLRFVLGLGTVNAFIIGLESTAQIDDLLTRTADALAFVAQKA